MILWPSTTPFQAETDVLLGLADHLQPHQLLCTSPMAHILSRTLVSSITTTLRSSETRSQVVSLRSRQPLHSRRGGSLMATSTRQEVHLDMVQQMYSGDKFATSLSISLLSREVFRSLPSIGLQHKPLLSRTLCSRCLLLRAINTKVSSSRVDLEAS